MINLDKYKNPGLTPEELEEFSGHFLRAKFNRERQKRWEGMLADQEGISKNMPAVDSPGRIRTLLPWIASIAAVILLLLVAKPIMNNFSSPSYEQLANAYITENFFENPTVGKGNEDVEQIKLNAIEAYNNKSFQSAIQYFQSAIASGATDKEQYFFLGLSLLYNEQADEAVTSLKTAIELDMEGAYEQENQWFLALAYIKNGDIDDAKSILTSFKEGMWNFDKAQQLLESMK